MINLSYKMLKRISEKVLEPPTYHNAVKRNELLEQYKHYIKTVMQDGVIDYGEHERIREMRTRYAITNREHTTILKELDYTDNDFSYAVSRGLMNNSTKVFGEVKSKTASYVEDTYHKEYFHGFIKTPHLHQWYEYDEDNERILYRSKEERHASWNELFYDLIHVAFLSNITHGFAEDPSNYYSFIVMFFTLWNVWSESVFYSSLYSTNDFLHKVYYYFHMFGVACMILNTDYAWANKGSWGFAASYVAAVLPILIMYIYSCFVEKRTHHNIYRSIFLFISLLLWVLSGILDKYYYPIWLTALSILEVTNMVSSLFGIIPPITIDHWTERLGLFIIITLGEAVLAILTAKTSTELYPPQVYLGAALGLLIAFCIMIIFYDVELSTEKKRHALIRNRLTAMLFTHLHGVFAFGVVFAAAGAVGIQHHIASHYSNTTVSNMTNSTYIDHTDYDTSQWLLAIGCSICIFILFFFGLLSSHHGLGKIKRFIPHKYRVIIRLFVGVVLSTLPVYLSGLDGLKLLGTASVFSMLLAFAEILGSLIIDRTMEMTEKETDSSEETETIESEESSPA